MTDFRHGRLLFVGDAAHQVSPFGARGANSGIQDTDNLVWKLAAVIAGTAPESLLDSYAHERESAADENLLNSTRATDFMTPKSRAARTLRDAVLSLAAEVPGVRALVNSGRLSVPSTHADSPLNTPDAEAFDGWMVPGAPMDDAPVKGPRGDWLLPHLAAPGTAFTLLYFGTPDAATRAAMAALPLTPLLVDGEAAGLASVQDVQGLVARRCGLPAGGCLLVRPDQHVAARWRRFDAAAVRAALDRACGR
jgi:3-(3-hydroxy-phenyl)propionate hydroxylase